MVDRQNETRNYIFISLMPGQVCRVARSHKHASTQKQYKSTKFVRRVPFSCDGNLQAHRVQK